MSPRAREAIDGALDDPDVAELRTRVKGFARERLLQAEEAASILKEDQEPTAGSGTVPGGSGSLLGIGAETLPGQKVESDGAEHTGVAGVDKRDGKVVSRVEAGAAGGKEGEGAVDETPILSGLMTNAKDFLEGRVREVTASAGEVWDMAKEARESSRRTSSGDGSSRGDDGGTKMLGSGSAVGGEDAQRPRPAGDGDAGSGHEEKEGDSVVGEDESMSRRNSKQD